MLFSLLWITFVYCPLAHMVWAFDWFYAVPVDKIKGAGGSAVGLLGQMGALDFAGGTVVHIAAGAAALACILVLRKRSGYPEQPVQPNSLVLTLLGAGLLWFGWFGFNGGSGLVAGNLASLACLTTNTAAAAAALGWMLLETWQRGKPTAVGVATGAVAGLVAITPAAGYVSPLAAVLIGFAAALVCSYALQLKNRWRLDDSLDVLPVHGVAGLLGTLLTGVFTLKSLNPAGADGLLVGQAGQLWIQLKAAGFTILFVGVGTFVILRLIRMVMPLRVNDIQEQQGLDINAHGEEAYNGEFTG
jgi:Amt family ammonium transporter